MVKRVQYSQKIGDRKKEEEKRMEREDQQAKKEHPSTYMVQDRSSEAEMIRLRLQDELLTRVTGGVLPEQEDPTQFQRVIDIGCGTGGWIIEVAKTHPQIEELVGIDVSSTLVRYARAHAEEKKVETRVTFHMMDALRMIEFPRGSFDLVNHRLNFSYLRTWDWPGLLQEYQRIARHNGIIRITEPTFFVDTNSQALNQLYAIGRDAFWHAGHLFTQGSAGVIERLPGIFHQQGIVESQTRYISVVYTENKASFIEDNQLIFRTIRPFLQKWATLPENYDQIYKQALSEMEEPGFRAEGQLLTIWGKNT